LQSRPVGAVRRQRQPPRYELDGLGLEWLRLQKHPLDVGSAVAIAADVVKGFASRLDEPVGRVADALACHPSRTARILRPAPASSTVGDDPVGDDVLLNDYLCSTTPGRCGERRWEGGSGVRWCRWRPPDGAGPERLLERRANASSVSTILRCQQRRLVTSRRAPAGSARIMS
jgi:hypothetical protein